MMTICVTPKGQLPTVTILLKALRMHYLHTVYVCLKRLLFSDPDDSILKIENGICCQTNWLFHYIAPVWSQPFWYTGGRKEAVSTKLPSRDKMFKRVDYVRKQQAACFTCLKILLVAFVFFQVQSAKAYCHFISFPSESSSEARMGHCFPF